MSAIISSAMGDAMTSNIVRHRLYAYVGDDRIDFVAVSTSKAGDSYEYYPHKVRQGESLMINLRNAMEDVPWVGDSNVPLRIIVSGRSTVMPIAEFQEEHAENVYFYTFPHNRDSHVFYDTLPGINAVLLFALPEAMCRIVRSIAPQSYYVSGTTPLLRHFARLSRTTNGKQLYAYFEGGCADVAVFHEGQLLLSNKFDTPTAEDAAYYILSCVDKLDMHSERDGVSVVGSANHKQEDLTNILRQYAENVRVLTMQQEYAGHEVAAYTDMPYPLAIEVINAK